MWNPFKKKVFAEDSCTAIWIGEVGDLTYRIFKILEKKDKMATISFDFPANKETYKIKEKYIRKKRVIIYKTSDEKIIVQNPDGWRNINLKANGIKELRFNLQNFSLQESKAANNRWTLPQDLISKLSPLFKILLIAAAVGVLGWSCLRFAGVVLEKVLSSRLLPCDQILPHIAGPIDAITTPVG